MNISKIELKSDCPICGKPHLFHAETLCDISRDCDKGKALAKCMGNFVTIYFRIHEGNIMNVMAYKGGFLLPQDVRKTLFSDLLKSVITTQLGIEPELMESKSREPNAVFARAIMFYLFKKKFPGTTLAGIGKFMKEPRTHGTVLHNIRQIEYIMASTYNKQRSEQKRLINEIENIIKEQRGDTMISVKPS